MSGSVSLTTPRYGNDELRSYSALSSAPGPLVRSGDFLRLNATSTDATATLNLNGRLLTMTGETVPFALEMAIVTSGNQTARATGLTDGWIIGFVVYISAGTITDGELTASVEVVQSSGTGATRVMCLASGGVTNTRELGLGAFTEIYNEPALDQGVLIGVSPADPAAGQPFLATVPASKEYEVQALQCSLQTTADVASRLVHFDIINAATAYVPVYGTTAVTAGQLKDFNFVAGLAASYTIGTYFQTAIIAGLRLKTGDQFGVAVENMNAADAISGVFYSVRSWDV